MPRKKSLYDFKNYKDYLKAHLEDHPAGGHGLRTKLAKAAGCQPAYLTRVLNGEAHLSLAQAQGACEFLGLAETEQHFFLLLIQANRAETRTLADYFWKQIDSIREERANLASRFAVKEGLSEKDKVTYYSRWYFVAIHVLVSIPEFQNKDAIASRLGLPLTTVTEALRFLVSTGMVIERNGRFSVGVTRIHLNRRSPLIDRHHTNWRLHGIDSLDNVEDKNAVHYTSVVSLSQQDLGRVQRLLIDALETYNSIVHDSKDEALACMTLDWFEIK